MIDFKIMYETAKMLYDWYSFVIQIESIFEPNMKRFVCYNLFS